MTTALTMSLATEPHPTIRNYVEALDRALMGEVPAAERALLVDEAAFILERIANERILLGASPDEAAQAAVAEYGDTDLLAAVHVEGAFEANPPTPVVQAFGRANSVAFGLFGCATLAYLVLLQLRVYLPSGEPLNMPFTPAQIRSIFPEPLPFPELSLSYLLTVGYPVVAPILVGALIGRRIPVRAAAAAYRALVPSILAAFVTGSLLLPNTEGLLFAVWQVVFWLPAGCLAAHLASSSARRKRARQAEGAVAPAPGTQNP